MCAPTALAIKSSCYSLKLFIRAGLDKNYQFTLDVIMSVSNSKSALVTYRRKMFVTRNLPGYRSSPSRINNPNKVIMLQ